MTTAQYLIFTDLDGTLLDHTTYSSEAALPVLSALQHAGIPVIPNTSKTFAEVKEICKQLQIKSPILVENGAAAYIPYELSQLFGLSSPVEQQYVRVSFTQPHAHWLAILSQVTAQFAGEFTSFSQLGIDGIVKHTGLSRAQANAAASREFTEPVLWMSSEPRKQQFMAELQRLGAKPVEGGRFIHVCGQCDKGTALQWLTKRYQQTLYAAHPTITIALGDGKNDIAMLEVADIAVRIKSPVHEPPTLQRTTNIMTTYCFGPEGWAEALKLIIPSL